MSAQFNQLVAELKGISDMLDFLQRYDPDDWPLRVTSLLAETHLDVNNIKEEE